MKHTPKPLIEEHYHIQDLIDRQDKRATDRSYHHDQGKLKAERDSLIKDTKVADMIDFWCDHCKEDFKSAALRQEEIDWSNPNQLIAFYKTKCRNKHWCMRYVTDKNRDPYWFKSKFVRADRANHTYDLMQSFEEGYNLLYGKK